MIEDGRRAILVTLQEGFRPDDRIYEEQVQKWTALVRSFEEWMETSRPTEPLPSQEAIDARIPNSVANSLETERQTISSSLGSDALQPLPRTEHAEDDDFEEEAEPDGDVLIDAIDNFQRRNGGHVLAGQIEEELSPTEPFLPEDGEIEGSGSRFAEDELKER